jgi:hypothetical protein
MFGAVPLNGFWNTRPMYRARRCSGQCVIVRPASDTVPVSTKNVPATALSSVDLPEPFMPMIVRNDPSSSVNDTSCSAHTSFGVPGLNVLAMFVRRNMTTTPSSRPSDAP